MKTQCLVLMVLTVFCPLTKAGGIERKALAGGGCPQGYKLFVPTEACFKVVKRSVTRDEAVKACLKDGADLATIKDPYENAAVRGVALEVGVSDVWIGLYWKDGVKKWGWSDNSPSEYTNWDDQAGPKIPRDPPQLNPYGYMHLSCCTVGGWANAPAYWVRNGFVCRAPYR